VRVCVAKMRVYMTPSSGKFSTCFVVSAHSNVCVFVCVYPCVVTYSGLLVLCYSHRIFCNLPNVFCHLCLLTCACLCVSQPHVVISSGHFDLSCCNTFSSHTSVFTPTPTSAHVFTVTFVTCHPKKGFQLAECLLPLQKSPS
jgi:hypothetical protein